MLYTFREGRLNFKKMKGVVDLSSIFCYFLRILIFFYLVDSEEVSVEKYYEEGKSIRLDCTVKNINEAMWQKDGQIITFGSIVIFDKRRISVGSNWATDYSLEITQMLKKDKGNYTCKNRMSNNADAYYNLKLKAGASIEDNMFSGPEVRAMENETVILWCNASGYPVLSVSWYVIEEDSIQEEKMTGLGINGNMLGIQRVSRSCASKFQCQAVSTYKPEKIEKRNITLIVDFFPEMSVIGFINNKSSSNILYGSTSETVKLSCTVFSSEPFNITWLSQRDKKELGWYSSQSGKSESAGIYGYSIKSNINHNDRRIVEVVLTVLLDTNDSFSNYSCNAENKLGPILKTIETRKKESM
ncbi:neuronal growth regulator 1-like [Saccostrea cucullata]|uniref:neuronal growth regulator 1-like n=1 Tax=Saccostrea cuccullata TaxID=36930 RepID=UPI002ED67632